MSKNSKIPRRDFVKTLATVSVAAPWFVPGAALGADGHTAASERIVMGGIGVGNQGSSDQGAFMGRSEVQYVAVCDVRRGVREAATGRVDGHYHNHDCKAYNDFRDLLARKDIDAVHVATPDHWHALVVIEACRQGKDVFCQKPETRTLREGPLMVAAARRYGRVVSGGSQRVLEDYKEIVNKCWGGELGTIKSINVNVGPLSRPCNLPAEPIPAGMDWDMWLGPAPWAPFNRSRGNKFGPNGVGWQSHVDYSGGEMTNWGAHHFGGALFAANVRELEPVEITYHHDKRGQHLTYRFPNGLLVYHHYPGMGNLQVVGTPGEKLPPVSVPTYKGTGGIYGDFLACCKTRQRPFRDIELAIHTVAVCHLGIIAYGLKRSLKWDQAKQEFPGDQEANRLLDRARREPWLL